MTPPRFKNRSARVLPASVLVTLPAAVLVVLGAVLLLCSVGAVAQELPPLPQHIRAARTALSWQTLNFKGYARDNSVRPARHLPLPPPPRVVEEAAVWYAHSSSESSSEFSSESSSDLTPAPTPTPTTTTTTTTTTEDPTTPSTPPTPETTGSPVAPGDGHSKGLSNGALAGIIVGCVGGGLIIGAGAVAVVVCCPCALLCCQRRAAAETYEDYCGTEVHEMDHFGSLHTFHGNQIEHLKSPVKELRENDVCHSTSAHQRNPLKPSLEDSPRRSPPTVTGDPAHVNTFNNRPYVQDGIVPWTGRPPVMRGPQPACMVPTITKDGTVIPREQRVLPGLGLLETPIIPINPPTLPLSLPRSRSPGVVTRVKDILLFKAMRRRLTGAAAKEHAASTAGAAEAPVLQWFHQLVYFTPVENSPPLSQLGDDPNSETGERHDDDVDTVAAGVTVPAAAVPTSAAVSKSSQRASTGTRPQAARASVSASAIAGAGPTTATHRGGQPYPATNGPFFYPPPPAPLPTNAPAMVMRGSLRDFDRGEQAPPMQSGGAPWLPGPPGGGARSSTAGNGGGGDSFHSPFVRPTAPQSLHQQQLSVTPQLRASTAGSRHSPHLAGPEPPSVADPASQWRPRSRMSAEPSAAAHREAGPPQLPPASELAFGDNWLPSTATREAQERAAAATVDTPAADRQASPPRPTPLRTAMAGVSAPAEDDEGNSPHYSWTGSGSFERNGEPPNAP
ncbi:hypothetical protein NESM_000217700 [Novymonas esmeraldas]|uniref:Uncharacterized protein n=1 Tax=Novymonas esmeraldas TaxID=1808958 RepID=A0AAW0FAT4_9TRYP